MHPNLKYLKQKNSIQGFSLLEVIAALLLLGIVASIWALGIVQATDAFILSRDSLESVQKARGCMGRLIKEFHEINTLSASPPPSAATLHYSLEKNGTDTDYTLMYDPLAEELKIDADVLADEVTAFTMNYYDTHDAASPLPSPVPAADVRIIEIVLEIRNADNTVSAYTNRVFLRGLES